MYYAESNVAIEVYEDILFFIKFIICIDKTSDDVLRYGRTTVWNYEHVVWDKISTLMSFADPPNAIVKLCNQDNVHRKDCVDWWNKIPPLCNKFLVTPPRIFFVQIAEPLCIEYTIADLNVYFKDESKIDHNESPLFLTAAVPTIATDFVFLNFIQLFDKKITLWFRQIVSFHSLINLL